MTILTNNFLIILISLFMSWIILKIKLSFFERVFLDKPNLRSSHQKPIPRGGGISFFLVSTLIFLFAGKWKIIFLLPLALVGFVDDLINISSKLRFVVQFITVIIIFSIENLFNLKIFEIEILNSITTLALLITSVGIINIINFMDGIDGLVAGCMIVIFSVMSITLDPVFWSVVGSLFGFILWNWSPAKLFMGDIGSTYLGALFVFCLTKTNSTNDLLGLFLIATPLIADSVICIILRYTKGQNIFEAHNLHLYQRLFMNGWKHNHVSLVYIFCCLVIALSYLYLSLQKTMVISFLILIFGFIIDKKFAYPFNLASRKLNKS